MPYQSCHTRDSTYELFFIGLHIAQVTADPDKNVIVSLSPQSWAFVRGIGLCCREAWLAVGMGFVGMDVAKRWAPWLGRCARLPSVTIFGSPAG